MLHLLLSLFILCGITKYVISNVVHGRREQNDCLLLGHGTGVARDVNAVCGYQSNLEYFYYTISWKSPKPLKTENVSSYEKVSSYNIFITYGSSSYCFLMSKSKRTFEFTGSKFKKGHSMLYAVVPKTNADGNITAVMKRAVTCPVKPEILPLPNVVIPIGSNFTFRCIFKENPIPPGTIQWLISHDKYCVRTYFIRSKNVNISQDKRTLQIIKARGENVGCYIVIAENAAGTARQKGYINLNIDTTLSPRKDDANKGIDELAEVIGLIIGVVLLVGIIIAVTMRFFLKRQEKHLLVTLTEELVKKVYISHYTEERKNKVSLLKFVSIIKSFNVDVTIDICSEVSINSSCGLSQWVPANIVRADKIIILLTPSYLTALESWDTDNKNENVCKVHSEFNFVSDMLYNNCHTTKELVIISNGVKPKQFPAMLENKPYFKFPSQLNIDPDEDLDDNFRGIIGVLLEKEPRQLSSRNGYHHL